MIRLKDVYVPAAVAISGGIRLNLTPGRVVGVLSWAGLLWTKRKDIACRPTMSAPLTNCH